MKRRHVALTAAAGAAAGALGLTALSLPAGATREPELPPIAPEQLVESVMTAAPPAMTGTVEVEKDLGLPALPDLGQASGLVADGSSKLQVWTDGQGRQRVAMPSPNGELTVVDDGSTVWTWDSQKRTVTRNAETHGHSPTPERQPLAPADAARRIVDTLRQSSDVAVDGTASVAGRDAYELVLTPKPSERTTLREARIAVDAEKRIPLSVEVNTHGSDTPALRAAFSELDLSAPDAGLFRFTPPPGAKVEQKEHPSGPDRPMQAQRPNVVGDGWDKVVVGRVPERAGQAQPDVRAMARQFGKPVSGPWGQGWILNTKVGSALLASDGRFVAGAVPEQVLTAALGNA